MKKVLFVSLLFILNVSYSNAQSIDTGSIKIIAEKSQNTILNKQIFINQIEAFQIKKEDTFTKRRNKGKNKRKSKIKIILLNFAEHNFRYFTC